MNESMTTNSLKYTVASKGQTSFRISSIIVLCHEVLIFIVVLLTLFFTVKIIIIITLQIKALDFNTIQKYEMIIL